MRQMTHGPTHLVSIPRRSLIRADEHTACRIAGRRHSGLCLIKRFSLSCSSSFNSSRTFGWAPRHRAEHEATGASLNSLQLSASGDPITGLAYRGGSQGICPSVEPTSPALLNEVRAFEKGPVRLSPSSETRIRPGWWPTRYTVRLCPRQRFLPPVQP